MKNILVNGREKSIPHRKLTHEQIVLLAYGPTDHTDVVTVTYWRGPLKKPEGSLQPGESIALREGMSFTAVRTNRA